MDPVSIIGLVTVSVMFLTGLGLVWFGLTRRADPLPKGAADILSAVADGRLAAPAPRAAPATRPTPAPSTTRPAPARPVSARPTSNRELAAARQPARIPKGVEVIEPDFDEPSVRLVPRPGSDSGRIPARVPQPVNAGIGAREPVAAGADSTSPADDLTQRLFAEDAEHPASETEQDFFARSPQLHRF